MTTKSSILVLYTGGTIGMIQDDITGALQPFNFDKIFEQIPVLNRIGCELNFISFDPLIDSSNMHPKHWIKLVEIIEKEYKNYDGFVILHGSDTMAYTASALSFMLENLNKPVILTGSQLPLGMIRTDGRENFIAAIEIAAAKKNGVPVIPEVAIYFEDKLLRGNRTSKLNAENFNAFFSGNYPSLAEVGVHIKYNYNFIRKLNKKELIAHTNLNENVVILKLFPGISQAAVRAILCIPSLEAVILETFGAGNAPTEKWFIEELKNATNRGIIVVNVTQCKEGAVEIGKYETSVDLGKIGILGGYDITTESALTKLMYLLGEKTVPSKIKSLLQKSLRGELTI